MFQTLIERLAERFPNSHWAQLLQRITAQEVV
jgi:hypothetical protein